MDDKRLDRMEQKIDVLQERMEHKTDVLQEGIHSIDKTLIAQHENLKEHMKRSDMLETQVKLLEDDLKPLVVRNNHIDGALKFLGGVGLFVAFVKAIVEIFYK